jgi:hypothetical protein
LLYKHEKYEEAVGYLQSSFNWNKKMYGTCRRESVVINSYLCNALKKIGKFEESDYWFDVGSPDGDIPLCPFRD